MLEKHKAAKLALVALPWCTFPAQSADYFADLNLLYANVDIAGQEFDPWALRARLGFYFMENIALEAQYGGGVADDSKLGLDAEIKQTAAVNLRFQSPEQFGFRLSLFGGYAWTELELNRGTSSNSETLSSPALGIGVEQLIPGTQNLSFTADYTGYFSDDDVEIKGLSVGFKVAF
jgi:hypothetical protein